MFLAVFYYDGKSSRRHAATLSLESEQLSLSGDWGRRRFNLREVAISEPLGRAPRIIRFADGAQAEVADLQACAELLKAAGYTNTLSVRLHSRWFWAINSLLAIVAFAAAGYVWVLPWGAEKLAPHVPDVLTEQLSTSTLAFLDDHLLKPSKLPPQRLASIREKMANFAHAGGLPKYILHFRHAGGMPPNAFALPDGEIVIFDSLLASMSDEEAIAVFAHELGHVHYRHGLRQMMQSAVVSTAVGLYLGDLSTAAASLATVMLQADYSQSFETQADSYAAKALRRAGMSPMLLGDALQKLEAAYAKYAREARKDKKDKQPDDEAQQEDAKQKAEQSAAGEWLETLFSSHPSNKKRIEALSKQ